ncbi:MAG TPA: polysaccharide biosynthesis C-terminal domain-containing protein [Bacteroidota bacterium]|nr:polysaccharide biosynthesis C-terminal domain-containing protein [Bacteroidota bacterium]
MFDRILRLGKDTAVYGLSTVVGRLLNFLVVPLYANVLLPAENGIIANLYAYVAFVYVFYCYGMEQAYMRFVSSLEFGNKNQNFTLPFFSLLFTSICFSFLVQVFSPDIASLIGVAPGQRLLVVYAGWIICFDALSLVPFASLRMDRRPKLFAGLKVFNITLNLVLNLVLILGLKMRAEGVLLANLVASVLTFFLMLRVIVPQLDLRIPPGLYRALLKFGLPYIPAGLSGIAMQVIDRPIVRYLTNDATLGIYQLNYRLGIFMMLIVGMFDFAWRPFFLNHASDSDARQLFARVFTLFASLLIVCFLAVSFFIDDVVRVRIAGHYFFPPVYWPGTSIVPWILLSYVFTGAYVVFVVGVYLEKKTFLLPLITGAGAVTNIVANFLWVPRMGIMGAALATLASYIVMAAGMFIASQRYYAVRYEWGKVVRLAVMAAVAFVVFVALNPAPLTASGLATKSILLLAFCASLFFTRVIDTRELQLTRDSIVDMADRTGPEAPTSGD